MPLINKHKHGYSVIELMIVVTIIGMMAAIAIPVFKKIRAASQNARLASDFRTYSGVFSTFVFDNGGYPENSSSGAIPEGFIDYIKPGQWHEGPSIGGVWDVEQNTYGVLSAIGVHNYTVPDEQIQKFDEVYDDGSLSTGTYRQLDGDRYYYVVAE